MTPPNHLDGLALTEWRRVTSLIDNLPVRPDEADLATYCQSYARWAELVASVRAEGTVINTSSGRLQINPRTRSAVDAGKHVVQMLAALHVPGVPPLQIA